jgi:hypothetical protein
MYNRIESMIWMIKSVHIPYGSRPVNNPVFEIEVMHVKNNTKLNVNDPRILKLAYYIACVKEYERPMLTRNNIFKKSRLARIVYGEKFCACAHEVLKWNRRNWAENVQAVKDMPLKDERRKDMLKAIRYINQGENGFRTDMAYIEFLGESCPEACRERLNKAVSVYNPEMLTPEYSTRTFDDEYDGEIDILTDEAYKKVFWASECVKVDVTDLMDDDYLDPDGEETATDRILDVSTGGRVDSYTLCKTYDSFNTNQCFCLDLEETEDGRWLASL